MHPNVERGIKERAQGRAGTGSHVLYVGRSQGSRGQVWPILLILKSLIFANNIKVAGAQL
jgi:hypothetical protein